MRITAGVRNTVAAAANQVIDNPVLNMDLRTRTRKSSAFTILAAYVLLMAGVLLIAYASVWAVHSHPSQMSYSRGVGGPLFQALMWTQVILFSLIIPAIASGSLSREIERRTMELLALTPLTSGRIVIGKGMSSFLYCIGLLISSVPLSGICLMFGGISPAEVAISYVMLITWVFLLSAISVFWSSMFRLTPSAVLMTYATVIGYFLFTLSMGAMAMSYNYSGGTADVFILGGLNPAWTPYMATAHSPVCGIPIPLALVALALHLSVGALLLLIATTHVQYHRTRRPLPIRLLLIGITASLVWLVAGSLEASFGWMGATSKLSLVVVPSIIMLCCFALVTPLFMTGQVKKPEGQPMLLYAMSGRKLFKDDLGGGAAFILVWMVLVYAVFGITLLWDSKVNAVTFPSVFWPSYFRVGLAMVGVIAGMCGAGILTSSLAQRRAPAMLLAFLVVLCAFGAYLMVMPYQLWAHQAGRTSPIFQIAVLWPLTPILAVYDWGQNEIPKLWWPRNILWLVTGGFYFMFGIVAALIAGRLHKRTGGVQEDI